MINNFTRFSLIFLSKIYVKYIARERYFLYLFAYFSFISLLVQKRTQNCVRIISWICIFFKHKNYAQTIFIGLDLDIYQKVSHLLFSFQNNLSIWCLILWVLRLFECSEEKIHGLGKFLKSIQQIIRQICKIKLKFMASVQQHHITIKLNCSSDNKKLHTFSI